MACAGVQSTDPVAQCGVSELREGRLPATENLRLGKPALFDDGIGIRSGMCFPLHDGNRFVTWLHAYHQTGPRVFLQRCEAVTQDGAILAGNRSGGVADDYVELVLENGYSPEFKELTAPLWSEFSNPSFCKSYVAYWGAEFARDDPVRVHAIVYDLTSSRVVKDASVGSMVPESDSRDFLERPRWSSNAREVRFLGRDTGSGSKVTRVDSRQFNLDP